ncbi:MAG: ABC transporter ATP-binding protein [Bacteroidales bacterium]|jgi:ABC-type multidrug transport system ATPase subunit|nr:ABC transporter ATP-binding protein [Bacteroidales bacterium]MDD3331065.1 ABC transporter ATP-binding protein [Bacteroidales bacterium]MDD3691341.1 ABC transporter ATP-binding protein [Bacteroidales bacterium]MDD4045258.1 ABC transporter ATP-binding protein [Bacteroidales bacterium]MDD4582249.1 ABC transporter ATP-binding protein [Bacteroidales bacterium]
MKIIETENISKSFGKVQALTNINLHIDKGELFGLIGPDGAGKSTLFNILVTLLNPDSGTAIIHGYDLIRDYKQIRKIIGYLPGQFSLYKDLSCIENLEFFATLYGESIEKNYALIRPIWEQLKPFKDRSAANLSGGMKQKLALCCALIHRPRILILDEPTTGVDPISRREFWEILQSLNKEDITVLVSTSYMDEASLCSRIGLIQNGKLLNINTPEQILSEFKGYLYAVHTREIHQLLLSLKDQPFIDNAYASGQQVNIVLNNASDVELLEKHLAYSAITYTSVQSIKANTEDCFIQLMKVNQENT